MARTESEIRKDLKLVETWRDASAKDRQLLTPKAKKLLEINRHQLEQELLDLQRQQPRITRAP